MVRLTSVCSFGVSGKVAQRGLGNRWHYWSGKGTGRKGKEYSWTTSVVAMICVIPISRHKKGLKASQWWDLCICGSVFFCGPLVSRWSSKLFTGTVSCQWGLGGGVEWGTACNEFILWKGPQSLTMMRHTSVRCLCFCWKGFWGIDTLLARVRIAAGHQVSLQWSARFRIPGSKALKPRSGESYISVVQSSVLVLLSYGGIAICSLARLVINKEEGGTACNEFLLWKGPRSLTMLRHTFLNGSLRNWYEGLCSQ